MWDPYVRVYIYTYMHIEMYIDMHIDTDAFEDICRFTGYISVYKIQYERDTYR